ncbi:hypothetical protein GA0061098_104917 [Bradyrhizobium shewense]|uniref:Uncharacterized protein n=1 Tax=Bradyrhizobium shewense TaxID=1761772 RepID=A0A1C3XTZ6_9BRAD|nr:hypothetical protein GA0061098_104917 [Bradyrhizobium shewense]
MTVWLSWYLMQSMSEYARDLSPLENGGVLLEWRSEEDHIIVDLRGPATALFTDAIGSCRTPSFDAAGA